MNPLKSYVILRNESKQITYFDLNRYVTKIRIEIHVTTKS